jgi:hypothetical protein
MTLDACYITMRNRLHEDYEVCLDSGSQVNIVNSKLLNILRTSNKAFKSMNGRSETSCIGYLQGFYDCQVCDNCPTSVLSQADVEHLYPVMYVQGESYTIHMDDREAVFVRRDKMYLADCPDWLVSDNQTKQELHTYLNLLTVAEMERLYASKDIRWALEAGEFLRAMGYLTEEEAVCMIKAVNVANVPYSLDNIKRFYDIYVPGLRATDHEPRVGSGHNARSTREVSSGLRHFIEATPATLLVESGN